MLHPATIPNRKPFRIHREWFRSVSLSNRKSCPCCRTKLLHNEQIWSWGEYIRGKWHTIRYCCRFCFNDSVRLPLERHATQCPERCEIVITAYAGETLPSWLCM